MIATISSMGTDTSGEWIFARHSGGLEALCMSHSRKPHKLMKQDLQCQGSVPTRSRLSVVSTPSDWLRHASAASQQPGLTRDVLVHMRWKEWLHLSSTENIHHSTVAHLPRHAQSLR